MNDGLGARPAKAEVAYVLSMFPCWSETFLLREIVELRRQGLEVTIFSLRRCSEDLVHPEARQLVEEGRVIYPRGPRALVRFVSASMRHPLRLGRFLVAFFGSFHGSAGSALRSVASVVLAADFVPTLQARGIAHIHAPWGTYPSTAALYCHLVWGYEFSLCTHAHDLFTEDHGLAAKFRSARFARTISQFNRRFIAQKYAGPHLARLHVIHCGIDPEEFRVPEVLCDPPLLLSVGRLTEIKGFPDLIDACALLQQKGRPFRCVVVGEGHLRSELEVRIRARGLQGQVELAGSMSLQGIRGLLGKASCFVLPCVTTGQGDQDGIPTVLVEALAAEVPVVSCPTSGVAELVENELTGLLVPPHEPAGLAQAIERLLEDPALRARMRTAGRRKVEQEFEIRHTTGRLAELLRARET